MKVYPTMLLKTKDSGFSRLGYPRMSLKTMTSLKTGTDLADSAI